MKKIYIYLIGAMVVFAWRYLACLGIKIALNTLFDNWWDYNLGWLVKYRVAVFIAYPQGAGLCEHSSTEIGFIGFPFRQNMVWKNESHIQITTIQRSI